MQSSQHFQSSLATRHPVKHQHPPGVLTAPTVRGAPGIGTRLNAVQSLNMVSL
jgi:hypothetical protein